MLCIGAVATVEMHWREHFPLPLPESRPAMSHLKGIAFKSPEVALTKLRDRLRSMSAQELTAFGKGVRGLSAPRVNVPPDPRKIQL
jgi:hypothetical protein